MAVKLSKNKIDALARQISKIGCDACRNSLIKMGKNFSATQVRDWGSHQDHIKDAYRAIAKWHLQNVQQNIKVIAGRRKTRKHFTGAK